MTIKEILGGLAAGKFYRTKDWLENEFIFMVPNQNKVTNNIIHSTIGLDKNRSIRIQSHICKFARDFEENGSSLRNFKNVMMSVSELENLDFEEVNIEFNITN